MIATLTPGAKVNEVIEFSLIECANCSIPFFVPTRLEKALRNSHEGFYCPHGHNNYFPGKNTEEKLKEELDRVKAEKAKEEEALTNRWLDALNEKNAIEKKLKRAHKGVCTCCNRSFTNLRRHMETKHPELTKAKN